jgi:hypothetical protein
MRGRIDAWLAGTFIPGRRGIDAVHGTQAIDIHMDELFPELKSTTEGAAWLAPAIAAFGMLYDALGSRRDRVMARLTVGLWADETINLNPPDFARIDAELDAAPPELHVTDRELEKFYWPVEGYVLPITWPEVAARCPWARVTYRAWRQVRNEPEEFSRFVEVMDQPAIV